MSVADLRKKVDIAPNTMIRLKRDQEVTMYLLERICDELDVGVDDTLEHTPEKKRVIERDDF